MPSSPAPRRNVRTLDELFPAAAEGLWFSDRERMGNGGTGRGEVGARRAREVVCGVGDAGGDTAGRLRRWYRGDGGREGGEDGGPIAGGGRGGSEAGMNARDGSSDEGGEESGEDVVEDIDLGSNASC